MRLANEEEIGREMRVDCFRSGFVIGVAREIAVFQHPKPVRAFLNQSQLKRRSQAISGRVGFKTRFLGVRFQALPKQLERELEPLDGGVPHKLIDRLSQRSLESLQGGIQDPQQITQFVAHRETLSVEGLRL